MDRPLELEIDVEHAKASMPFPALQENEVVERVVEVISLGQHSHKFYTSAGRILERQG